MSTSASNDACLEVVLLCMFIPCINRFHYVLRVKNARTKDAISVIGLKLYWSQVDVCFLIQCYSLRTIQAYLTCSRCCTGKQPRVYANWAWKVRFWIRVFSLSSISVKHFSRNKTSTCGTWKKLIESFQKCTRTRWGSCVNPTSPRAVPWWAPVSLGRVALN